MNPEFVKTMNAIAEGTPKDINDPTDDTTFERTSKDSVKLYRVSDASGSLEITEAGSYPLSRDLLDSNVRTLIGYTVNPLNSCDVFNLLRMFLRK